MYENDRPASPESPQRLRGVAKAVYRGYGIIIPHQFEPEIEAFP
jgi:hypothetical protein